MPAIWPAAVVGDADHERPDVQLDVAIRSPAAARTSATFSSTASRGHRRDGLGADDAGRQVAVDADDVGLAGGDRRGPAARRRR